jgi:hypothetical protein
MRKAILALAVACMLIGCHSSSELTRGQAKKLLNQVAVHASVVEITGIALHPEDHEADVMFTFKSDQNPTPRNARADFAQFDDGWRLQYQSAGDFAGGKYHFNGSEN